MFDQLCWNVVGPGDIPPSSVRSASSMSSFITCMSSVSSTLLVLFFSMLLSGFSS